MKQDSERDLVRIRHILEAIEKLQDYVKDVGQEFFFDNEILQDACLRKLEVIGEASNHISEETKSVITGVSWREMIGLRNLLIHEYFGIDINIIWTTIVEDIPLLKRQLIDYLNVGE